MRATPRDWAGLAVLVLPCLVVALDADVLNLAGPSLAAGLHPGDAELLWIMDSYFFVVAGGLIGAGVLGDRIGRRRLLLAGSAGFGAASLLAAFAGSPGQLIAARVLMGLSGASLMPSTLALIRDMFRDSRERGIALGIWSAGFSLGGLAGPLIGGVLLDRFWWGSVFLIGVPAVVLLLILGPFLLPESRDPAAARFDLRGALLAMAAILTFVYGLKSFAASGPSFDAVIAVLVAMFLGYAFARTQRLIDTGLFRDGRITVALTANALSFFVLYGSGVVIAQYLQLVLGMNPLHAGLWNLPAVLAYLLASLLGPVLTRFLPAGRVIAFGLSLMALGFVVLSFGTLAAVVTGTVAVSAGLAPAYILTTDLVVSTAPPARAGMAGALTETGTELGGALGIAVLGSIAVAVYRHYTPLPLGAVPDAFTRAFTVMALTAAVVSTVAAVLAFKTLTRDTAESVATR